MISIKLHQELENVIWGNPWYGSSVVSILEKIDPRQTFQNVSASAHNMIEILLHMLGWTEEVAQRMQGAAAAMPARGDWPDPGEQDEQKWLQALNAFKEVNKQLLKLIQDFPEGKWTELISTADREPSLGTGVTFEQLINGLIQHDVYHLGQIALLNKIINAK